MKLKIKTKLSLGLGFLFAIIILLGSVGIFYTHAIAKESKEILKDNYESIQYAKVMMQAIDDVDKDSLSFFKIFETNLFTIIVTDNNISELLLSKRYSSKHAYKKVLQQRIPFYPFNGNANALSRRRKFFR